MATKRTEMGMEYWANMAECRDEPGQAGELRRAGRALDLLAKLTGYLRENYDADALDSTTTDMLNEANALLATVNDDRPQSDGGVLAGTNRTTTGAIGMP